MTVCASSHHFPFFFFNDTATTEIYTLSLHDALPIFGNQSEYSQFWTDLSNANASVVMERSVQNRSEEHTSELQSRQYLVCRLLLEKKKKARRRFKRVQPKMTPHPVDAQTQRRQSQRR